MATPVKNEKQKRGFSIFKNKSVQSDMRKIDEILGKANLELYGGDKRRDTTWLDNEFQKIISSERESLSNPESGDITSFLGRLYSQNEKDDAINTIIDTQFMDIAENNMSGMASFIYEAYQNRYVAQADLHEIASQLIELSEAISITRDAIISADVVEGRMNRIINFNGVDESTLSDNIKIVEKVEEKCKLLEKIKNFIVPNTLEYGEYYVYIIPYSHLFKNFMLHKDEMLRGVNSNSGRRFYGEGTTLFESVNQPQKKMINKNPKSETDEFISKLYTEYVGLDDTVYRESTDIQVKKIDKTAFTKDMTNILKNISVSNESCSIAELEYGSASIGKLSDDYFTENAKPKQYFESMMNNEGIYDDAKSSEVDFSEIKDCYIKLIDPTKIVPVKIVDQVIGYYYVVAEDITPLSGVVSSSLYMNRFDEHSKQKTIIDAIAERVIERFDKDFLKNNIQFKKLIVESLNYYNLNEKRLKFQFIPAEYIQEFKIDEDVDGNGQSMIKKSLFYAKLYLMLLLFKIMSIVMNSNDTKVNYIRTSGINKNISNKIQDIVRKKQARQLNMMDLFNYSTMVNKIGKGLEMYIPTGRGGNDRPIETEILSGQDVQLNSDLLEMLKNSYILATGVPAAIINYLNEADFAKQIEQNNSKFNGRVVNYQLDFNPSITSMYKMILKNCTNIPQSEIDNFTFTLQPPKFTTTNTKKELIDGFEEVWRFVQTLYAGENMEQTPELMEKMRELKILLAKDRLPSIDFDDIEEKMKKAGLFSILEKLRPKPENGDSGDDDGLEDALGGQF